MKREDDPYRLALHLLRWVCPDHLYEEIAGDLIQTFDRDIKIFGERKAKRRLAWNGLRFFRPGIVFRNKFSNQANPLDMFNHFFKVFYRTTLNERTYSIINISGLAVGLASSIFILLWINDEITFDQFHESKERIFKVMGNHTYPDYTATMDATPGPLSPALKELPEIEESCHLTDQGGRILFTGEGKSIYEEGIYAESSIFKIFTISIVSGSSSDPLPDNNSVAISKKLASRYFGDEDPIGKTFRLDNKLDVKVTALFSDLPENSTLQFEFILPYALYARDDQYNQEWGAWTGGLSFVKLRNDANRELVEGKIDKLFTKPRIWPRWDTNVALFLFPMNDWRLRDSFELGKQEGGRINSVRALSAVAIFLLLIACVNFMNLATARSVSRSREVGVRKVVGAGRRSLIGQFMGESVLISAISMLVSLALVHLLLPAFNELTGKQLTINYTNPIVYRSLIGITLLTGITAGIYPAFFLSSLKAINVLKGKLSGLSGVGIRKSLVVVQFSLSVVLIISAMVVYRQLNYMRNKNLGFDKENIFYIRVNDALRKNFNGFKAETLQNPSIKSVARSDDNPMDIFGGMVLADNAWPGKTKEDNIAFKFLQCDDELLPALGFTFVEGRNFSNRFISDSANYIINEEAVRQMKLNNPVGQFLVGPRKGNIVGVVKDFHTSGLQKPIGPLIIAMNPGEARRIFIKYEKGGLDKAMAHVQTVYRKYSPDFPMEYKFMDETFGQQYQDEILIGKLATCFTAIAIFISCLGLFGLASFTAERRAKEISIRKVLGATVSQLIALLCQEFVLLIFISLLIGLPLAGWGVQQFLQRYAFHVDFPISVFVITAMSLFGVALLTVSYQSARAALMNPAKSLRSE